MLRETGLAVRERASLRWAFAKAGLMKRLKK